MKKSYIGWTVIQSRKIDPFYKYYPWVLFGTIFKTEKEAKSELRPEEKVVKVKIEIID